MSPRSSYEIYQENMIQRGHGFPQFCADPEGNTTLSQVNGVVQVQLGDLGHFEEGRFIRLETLNVRRIVGVGNYGELWNRFPLDRPECAGNVKKIVVQGSASAADSSGLIPIGGGMRLKIQCARGEGAILNLESGTVLHRYFNKETKTALGEYMLEHYNSWMEGRDYLNPHDLFLVTGTYMTKNWEAAALVHDSKSIEAEASVNAVLANGELNIGWSTWTPGHRGFRLGHLHSGDEYPDPFSVPSFKACCQTCNPTPENQCVFLRGWKIREMLQFMDSVLVAPISIEDVKRVEWRRTQFIRRQPSIKTDLASLSSSTNPIISLSLGMDQADEAIIDYTGAAHLGEEEGTLEDLSHGDLYDFVALLKHKSQPRAVIPVHDDEVIALLDDLPQHSHREHQPYISDPSEIKMQHKRFHNLFALVIGIDIYKNANGAELFNLKGAVADANAVYDFLRNQLMVPDRNVCNLRNEEATRNNIINAIESLVSNRNIENSDPIFIYYAGHGATSNVNSYLISKTYQSQIEIIAPSDINLASDPIPDSGVHITGIAYYEINLLLDEIAREKGNNITMFLDCCHSASLNRSDDESKIIRQMSNPAPFTNPRVMYLSQDNGFVPKRAGLDSKSYVLLAACGRGERAMEKNGRGIFTAAILGLLSKSPIQTFSYRSLLLSLQLELGGSIDEQTPHCVGVFDNRRMFELKILDPRPRGEIRGEEEYIIPLGAIHGMYEGLAINIYTHSEGKEKALGRMEIRGPVAPSHSFLTFGSCSEFKIPNPFFVATVGTPPGFTCFCSDNEVRAAMEMETVRRCPGLKFSNSAESNCDVTITREQGKVVISRTVSNRKHRSPPLIFRDYFYHEVAIDDTLSSSNLEVLCYILYSAAWFYHHLTREALEDSGVKVELLQLKGDSEGYFTPLHEGNIFIKERSASIDLTSVSPFSNNRFSRPIGMRLHNDHWFDLQSYVFYFNPRDLKIVKWQCPSFVRPAQEPDTEFPKNSFLEIGFNNSNVNPFEFYLSEGLDEGIGYFKVFVARRTCAHLEEIDQDPLFDTNIKDGVAIRPTLAPEMPRWWGSEVVEVIQRGSQPGQCV